MRKKLTFKLSSATLLLFLILCLSLTANGQTKKWEVFTAKTEEGIVLKFCVSDVENKECHVGANDGKRAVEWAVVLRAVNTKDAMSATVEEIPYDVLFKIRDRILKEVKGVNRVLYDITPKPTGTIEWE